MNITRTLCDYCHQPRDFSTDIHGCEQSLKAQAYVASLVDSMKAMREPRTSEPWDPHRGQRFRDLVTSIKLSGGETRQEN
jgi:hypothetical protein